MHNHYNNDGKNNLKDIHLALILNFLSKKGDVTECMDEGETWHLFHPILWIQGKI